MPKCLEPNQRFPIVLDSDQHKPEESRPTFFVLALSMRDQIPLMETIQSWRERQDLTGQQMFKENIEQLKKVVVGWTNMVDERDPDNPVEIEFAHENFELVLGFPEARELVEKCFANNHVSPEEKKSSESQP